MNCGPEECEEDLLGERMTPRLLNVSFHIWIERLQYYHVCIGFSIGYSIGYSIGCVKVCT